MAAPEEAPAGIFSLEMTKDQVVTRLAFMIAGMDQDDFEQRCAENKFQMGEREEAERKLAEAICKIDGLPIWIEGRAGLTTSNITARIEKMKAERNLGVVFIDHLGKAGDGAKSLYEKTTLVSGRIADMAKDCDVPVVTLCQLNREAESKDRKSDRRPRLSDLRESGAIEQDARVVLGLYRDDYYSDTDENFSPIYPGVADLLQVIVLKANERKAGRMIPIEIDPKSRRLRDWPMHRESELQRGKS
jgi:replicative DNA helicase